MAGSDSDDEGSDSDDDDVGSDEADQILGSATAKKEAKPKARAAGGGGRRRGRAQTGGSRRSSTKRTKTLLTFAALHHMPEHTQGLYVQSLQKQDLIDLRSSIEQETREAVDLNAVDNRRPSVSDLKEGTIDWLRVNKPTGRKRDRSRFENKRKKVHEADFHCFVVSKISGREEKVASVSIPTLGEGDTMATYERISGISGDESDTNADVFVRIEISDVRGANEDWF